MPALNSGKILVTGANGYIAIWVVKAFLDRGFAVKGTVRSDAKGAQLQEIFKDCGGRLEYVIVADMAKEGAFDEAVKDVDAIVHTASPFSMNAVEPDELIVPAVKGTTGILASAHQFGTNVKRVILTSSGTAIASPSAEPRIVNENDWNDAAVREVHEKGREASQIEKYRASKTLAERAAWEWYDAHKASLRWDMVILNPSFVIGPWIHPVDKVENLNESLSIYYAVVLRGKMNEEMLVNTGTSWVDVRDVAEAHVVALLQLNAGGERIIVSSGPFKWQDLILAARQVEGNTIPPGNTSYEPSKAIHAIRYRTEKEERILGVKHHTLDETTRDTLHAFHAKGWL
ncbi:NAD(P)-binding protein [Cerioporus squamosus]|nr:NAD(P)-binding protein [Cerioporus squamosus]